MEDEHSLAEFFTQQYRVTARVWTGPQRLTDLLDDELSSTLELKKVQVARVIAPKEVVATHDSALLEKKAVMFAIDRKEGSEATVRRFYKHVDTTEWDVFLTVPSFELWGSLHVRGTGSLKTMLVTWSRQFIPLTRARAVFALYPEVSFSGGVIIVNRSYIELVCTDA